VCDQKIFISLLHSVEIQLIPVAFWPRSHQWCQAARVRCTTFISKCNEWWLPRYISEAQQAPALIKFPLHLQSTYVHVSFCFSWEFGNVCHLKGFWGKRSNCFRKEKLPNCLTVLVINFSINWIYQESSCFYFPQLPWKMSVLNEVFEDIKVFLERTSSSDQNKSTPCSFTFKSLRCYVLHYVSQKFNSFPFFIISWKSWKCLIFSSHFFDFLQKNKKSFPKDQNLCRTLPLLKHLS